MVINIFMFIFFACPKKTNQKKRQPFTWSAKGGLPCAVHKKRATSESRTPCGVLRRVADPFFIALLGVVKWQSNRHFVEKL
jgi:hypothetical protein